jgi:hypothetical protein
MFQVQQTLISDDIALSKFACHLTACKGACCVVGEGGAPVDAAEVSVLHKAYQLLKDELSNAAINEVESNGLIQGPADNLDLACVGTEECVFVIKNEHNVSLCSIQKAYYEGRFNWEKPLSCHLFPIRVTSIGDLDFLNFEYVPEICSPGSDHGMEQNIFLAEYLENPLIRKYGKSWYDEFLAACKYVRSLSLKTTA